MLKWKDVVVSTRYTLIQCLVHLTTNLQIVTAVHYEINNLYSCTCMNLTAAIYHKI